MENRLSNPTPLGFLGMGMAVVLAGFHFAGVVELSAMILAMALFFGGIAEILAGIMEYRRDNTFKATMFLSYGLFWFSFVYMVLSKDNAIFGNSPSSNATSVYMLVWAIFTFFMWLATFGKNKIMQIVFMMLFAMFVLQTLGSVSANESLIKISGWAGVISGFSAIYLALASVLNEARERTILPAGEMA